MDPVADVHIMKEPVTSVKGQDTQQETVEDEVMVVALFVMKRDTNKHSVQRKNKKKQTMKVEVMVMIRPM